MGSRILALVIKEFLAVWRDPKSRFVLIGPPLIQLLVFSYAANYDIIEAPLAVLDLDGGPAAHRLIDDFDHSGGFRVARHLDGEKDIAPAIDSRAVSLVLVVPADFSRRLNGGSSGVEAGKPAVVQVIADGRASNSAQVLIGYASTILTRFNGEWLAAHGGKPVPAAIITTNWFNPNLVSRWFIVPGLVAVLTLVVVMVVVALSVARERELGTFEQLLVTPLRPFEIMVGKTVPGVVIGLGEATLAAAIAHFGFGIPFLGSLPLFYGALVLYLLAVIAFGLMISSLAHTQQQAILGAFLFIVPAIILSGFATPIENMPDWVQWLTHVNPIRYFLIVVRGTFLKDLPLADAVHELWPMAIIAAVNLSLAAWLFRRRLY
ncbi:MAG: ABC transporter permease [Rhodobacterales bacterium]|nr:ABC transporter permease [Rhodobacterales bacterium]